MTSCTFHFTLIAILFVAVCSVEWEPGMPQKLRERFYSRDFGCLADYTWVVQGQVICYNSTGGYCAGEANGLFSAWFQFEAGLVQYYREDTILSNTDLVYSSNLYSF